MTNYQKALESGNVIVRKTFLNERNPEQVTVQFQQRVESPNASSGPGNLIAFAQGMSMDNKTTLTALLSFKKEVATNVGLQINKDYMKDGEIVEASTIFQGAEVNLQLEESTEPFYDGQSPKINPSTKEVLTLDGKPIYRSVTLVAGEAVHSTVQHNGVKSSIEAEIGQG